MFIKKSKHYFFKLSKIILFFKFTVLFFVLIIMGCTNINTKSKKVDLVAIYVIGHGNIIYHDFKNKDGKTLYKPEHWTNYNVDYISQKGDNIIIFQQSKGIHGNEFFIKELELSSGKIKELVEGEMPVYLKKHKKLFFYKLGDNQKKWLFCTSFDNEISSKPIKLSPAPPKKMTPNGLFFGDTHEPVIPISSDEIVFLDHKDELTIYNAQSNSFREVQVKGFKPLFWREKNKTLFVKNISSKEVGYIDLDTRKFIRFTSLKKAWGFIYDPKKDLLIYSQGSSFLIPDANTYVRNLTSGEHHLLMEKPITSGIIFRRNEWVK